MDVDNEILYRVLTELYKIKDSWQAQLTITNIIQNAGEPNWADFYREIDAKGLIEHKTHAICKISKKGELVYTSYVRKRRAGNIRNIAMWATLIFAAISAWLSYYYGSKSIADKPLPQKSQPTIVKTKPLKQQSKDAPILHKTATKKSLQTDSIHP
jgi:hypothetical protein